MRESKEGGRRNGRFRRGKGRREKGGFEDINEWVNIQNATFLRISLICQREVGYKVFGLIGFGGVVKVPFRG